MNHCMLGRTGLSVSEIGLGTEFLLGLPQDDAVGVIHEAIDRGISYIDLFLGQSEFWDNMGAALCGRREDVYITAHLGSTVRDGRYAMSRDPQVCTDSFHDYLERMGTAHVDVLFVRNCSSAGPAATTSSRCSGRSRAARSTC